MKTITNISERFASERASIKTGLVRYGPLLGSGILLTSAAFYIAAVYRFYLERWDDAYITFRFARHLADGLGLIWNVGGERVEGFTSLFHVVLISIGTRLGIDPWLSSILIGIVSVLVTAAVIILINKVLFGAIEPAAAVLIGLYLVDQTTAIHSTSGLETQLFASILCVIYFIAAAFVRSAGWGLAGLLGAAVFLSCLTRPEAAVYAFATYLVLAVSVFWRKRDTKDRRNEIGRQAFSAGIVILAAVAYSAWKLSYFGYLLPNPFYVKSNDFALHGLPEVSAFILHLFKWIGPVILVTLVTALIGPLGRRSPTESSCEENHPQKNALIYTHIFLALAPACLALGFYTTIIHEVGGGFRFSYPVYGLLTIALTIIVTSVLRLSRVATVSRFALIAVSSMWLGAMILANGNWRLSPVGQSTFYQYHLRVANALRDTGIGPDGTVLCDAAGLIPYVSGFNSLDRVGLVDNFLSGRTKPTESEREQYIWGRHADVYVGFEPPALLSADDARGDPQMRTYYVSTILMKRSLKLIESRIILQDPTLLAARMRRLRDDWSLIGELDYPDSNGLRSFLYVRRDSPFADRLTSSLRSIVKNTPDQIDLDLAALR